VIVVVETATTNHVSESPTARAYNSSGGDLPALLALRVRAANTTLAVFAGGFVPDATRRLFAGPRQGARLEGCS